MKNLYIGTSGWAYDWHTFYPSQLPKKEQLSFYSTQFKSVEVNYSFYRLPRTATYQQWFDQTPAQFLFALKLSRYITHVKRLHGVKRALKLFIKPALSLHTKCGPLLVQLPKNFKIDAQRLELFLKTVTALNKELKVAIRYAFEFRHESWFHRSIITLLRKYDAALVLSHSPTIPYPPEEWVTTDFVYIRLHGPGRLYASSYSTHDLSMWAKKIRAWHAKRKSVYVYFNNDFFGYAPANAETLTALLEKKSSFSK